MWLALDHLAARSRGVVRPAAPTPQARITSNLFGLRVTLTSRQDGLNLPRPIFSAPLRCAKSLEPH